MKILLNIFDTCVTSVQVAAQKYSENFFWILHLLVEKQKLMTL